MVVARPNPFREGGVVDQLQLKKLHTFIMEAAAEKLDQMIGVGEYLDEGMFHFDSPIERLFFSWVAAKEIAWQGSFGYRMDWGGPKDAWPNEKRDPFVVTIIPQARIDRYRVDFLFVIGAETGTKWLVIECDGHDYHEKTKKQARHDRSRDRYMAERGIRVMRFTGSEIYEDAEACVEQAHNMIYRIMEGLA